MQRGDEQDRIDFLAQARNRALEPLWLSASAMSEGSETNQGDLARDLASWSVFSARDATRVMWPAQKVVFLNDVYFCAQDVFR